MESDTDSMSNVSSHESPSPDHVPPIHLVRPSYTVGWVPHDIIRRHAGAALFNTVFEMPQQRPVVVFVPTEAYWELTRSQPTQKILKATSLWRFFRLNPWGPDYRRAWELQCSLQRNGNAEVTGFDEHLVQITVIRQMVREALHTTGVSSTPRKPHSEREGHSNRAR